jgi:hypothetical protein
MSRQQELGKDDGDFEEAHIFYRRVKSQDRLTKPISERIESPSELSDVDELLDYIRSRKLRYPIDINETEMDELPKDLAIQVLEDGPEEDPVKFLLSQFCDSLRKRQRQANKYAMLVHFGSQFLLAHVRAERGMSIKEEEGEIELIRRFLDVDNILSAALFELTSDGVIQFSHFTDTGSDSFRAFLGVTKRKFHYQKKNVQVITFYKGKTGLECKFEFTNEEFEDKWLNGDEITLQGDQFAFNGERPHLINEIRWGGEQYESPRAFKSDFKEYSFSLDGERRRYQDLLDLESPEKSSVSIFDDDVEKAEDKQGRVEIYYKDGERRVLDKGNLPDNFHVIYANGKIDLSSSFADHIFADIINGVEISVFHPSQAAAANEFTVNTVTFLNIDRDQITDELKKFAETTHKHIVNLSGETASRCLTYVLLHVLSREVGQQFQKGIDQLININHGAARNRDVVSSKENEYGGLIEYKNKKDLEKKDAATEIVANIKTKLKDSDEKVFLWGIPEQTRELDGLNTQSWNDDRVTNIEERVNEQLQEDSFDYTDYHMQIIPLGDNGDRWIIAGLIY